jgi:hypothetical protein
LKKAKRKTNLQKFKHLNIVSLAFTGHQDVDDWDGLRRVLPLYVNRIKLIEKSGNNAESAIAEPILAPSQ